MRELLSKRHQRQLRLLEILFEQTRWFHISELAELLDCTDRSVKDDLASVKSSLPELLFQSSTNGVRILNTDDSDIEMVYHHFFNQSTNFSILEFIFFNEGMSVEDLCQQFFISTSSLYRITNHINRVLRKRYQFEISLNPLEIKGNEIDIRYFFAQYFSEKYPFLEWPFEAISPQPLSELLKFVQETTQFPMDFSTFQMLRMLLVINLYRLKNHHLFELAESKADLNGYEQYLHSADYERISNLFWESYRIQLNQELVEQLFASYAQTHFYIHPDSFQKAIETDDYTRKSYHFLSEFIRKMEQKYQLKVENKELVIWHLHNTAHLNRQELFSEYILFDQKGNTMRNFKHVFPRFVTDVETGLSTYAKELNLSGSPQHINHLAHTFITHSSHLVLNLLQNQPRLKVLILSNFDQYHAQSIADTLSYYCSNNFELYTCDELEISIDYLEESPYDIIISNFILPTLENKRIIYSNNINIIELISTLNSMIFIEPEE